MGAVLINTYRKSKLAYLYTTATLLFLSPILQIASCIFIDWYTGCYYFRDLNSKCQNKPLPGKNDFYENLLLMDGICDAMSYCFYHQAHFLFAYRYFEVAEMFGREDKTMEMHIKVRKLTSKVSYLIIGLIALNYLLNISNWLY